MIRQLEHFRFILSHAGIGIRGLTQGQALRGRCLMRQNNQEML
jgi:hypothetical protein